MWCDLQSGRHHGIVEACAQRQNFFQTGNVKDSPDPICPRHNDEQHRPKPLSCFYQHIESGCIAVETFLERHDDPLREVEGSEIYGRLERRTRAHVEIFSDVYNCRFAHLMHIEHDSPTQLACDAECITNGKLRGASLRCYHLCAAVVYVGLTQSVIRRGFLRAH